MDQRLTDLRERLLEEAFLFDDPATYRAGVLDALAAIAELTRTQQPPTDTDAVHPLAG